MDDHSLYETDFYGWTREQAEVLRGMRHHAGLPNSLDLENVIEEIESVGRSQVAAVRSLLTQALLHDLKAEAWPLSRDVSHWRGEARRFRVDAADSFTPSMRQLIDVETLYRRALYIMPERMDDQLPLPVPATCPVTLDELLKVV